MTALPYPSPARVKLMNDGRFYPFHTGRVPPPVPPPVRPPKPTPRSIKRLSPFYHFHDAPEVVPGHMRAYDGALSGSASQKPLLFDADSSRTASRQGVRSHARPPRIIFGLKFKTFLLVALVVILILVGASVGGAVGGSKLRRIDNQMAAMTPTSTSTSTSNAAPSTLPTPTYSPLSACVAWNDTAYISQYTAQTDGSTMTPPPEQRFALHCDAVSPLSHERVVVQAFVFGLSDCIELCAAYNARHAQQPCNAAVYRPNAARPANCWVGWGNVTGVESWALETGQDVALLVP